MRNPPLAVTGRAAVALPCPSIPNLPASVLFSRLIRGFYGQFMNARTPGWVSCAFAFGRGIGLCKAAELRYDDDA